MLPVPDGDMIGIIGGDEPRVSGVHLDLPDLLIGGAKRRQPHHFSGVIDYCRERKFTQMNMGAFPAKTEQLK